MFRHKGKSIGVSGPPRELEIERQPTPVEIDRTEEAGRENDVKVPLLQSRWASFALACAVLSLLFAIFAFGREVLFVVWFVIGSATFIWWMWRSSRYVYEDEYGREHNAVTILDFFVGCGVTLFTGGLAWCVWRVAALIVPPVALPPRLVWLRGAWDVIAPIAALVAVVFSVSFFVHVEISFLQKLVQASVFQQQHIWAAIGRIIGGDLPPWWWQHKQQRADPRPLPPQPVRIDWVENNGNTGNIQSFDGPLPQAKMEALAQHILVKQGDFSEPACCGNGAGILSQTEYHLTRDWMIKRGFARWKDNDNHRQGVEFMAKGMALLRAFLPKMEYETEKAPPAPPYGDNGGSE